MPIIDRIKTLVAVALLFLGFASPIKSETLTRFFEDSGTFAFDSEFSDSEIGGVSGQSFFAETLFENLQFDPMLGELNSAKLDFTIHLQNLVVGLTNNTSQIQSFDMAFMSILLRPLFIDEFDQILKNLTLFTPQTNANIGSAILAPGETFEVILDDIETGATINFPNNVVDNLSDFESLRLKIFTIGLVREPRTGLTTFTPSGMAPFSVTGQIDYSFSRAAEVPIPSGIPFGFGVILFAAFVQARKRAKRNQILTSSPKSPPALTPAQ